MKCQIKNVTIFSGLCWTDVVGFFDHQFFVVVVVLTKKKSFEAASEPG